MVVVLNVEHIPALALKTVLPVRKGTLHLAQIKGQVTEVGEEAVCLLSVKLNYHIQHLTVILGDILQRLFGRNHRRFCESHRIVMVEYVASELRKIFVEVRTVVEVEDTL